MSEHSPEDLRESLRELRKLKESTGWKWACSIAKEQIHTRIQKVMWTPCEGTAKAMEQEFTKGEAAGLKLFITMVDAAIEDFEERLKALNDGEESDEHSQGI